MLAVEDLLKRYCRPATVEILMTHGRMVAGKALVACAAVQADSETRRLVIEAAYLHDIGVCKVNAPDIDCHGTEPYICHGFWGRELLESEGLPLHALICERHTGVGLTLDDIVKQGLPLPHRDMTPESLAERIICYADLFFSKNPERLEKEKSEEKIRKNLAKFGDDKVAIFDAWQREFGAV
jgi:uncharacterized protein